MTNEEAKKILIQDTESLKANPLVTVDDCLYEALEMAIKALETQPCENCAQRPKGKWLNSGMDLYCSNCNYNTNAYHLLGRFCPNCGAEMDGDEE